jgi:hypothetical protein
MIGGKARKTTARRYGVVHTRLRQRLAPLVRAGVARCVYCGEQIVGAWDLGHSDDRSSWIGPTHPHCNRREAGLKAIRLRRRRRTVTSQQW